MKMKRQLSGGSKLWAISNLEDYDMDQYAPVNKKKSVFRWRKERAQSNVEW